MNRARHWVEAERLQAQGIDRINQIRTLQAQRGMWQDVACAQLEQMAGLYFQAAQISALLAQAGPGLDAEVARLQEERPPMPPPPPRPTLATVRDGEFTRADDCREQNYDVRGDCDGPVGLWALKANQYGEQAGSSVLLCHSHMTVGRAGGWVQ